MITNTVQTDLETSTKNYIISNALYVGVGTDSTTPTSSDTSLGAEVVRNPRQDYTENTSSVTISSYFTSTQANGTTLAEVGVFDSSTSGKMLSRDIYSDIVKVNKIEVWIDILYNINVTIN